MTQLLKSVILSLLRLGPGRPGVTRADVDRGGRKLWRAGVTARVLALRNLWTCAGSESDL
jgi:hypothetical protein